MSSIQPEPAKKFVDKITSNPAVPIGMIGFIAAATIGIRNFRKGGFVNKTAYFGSLRVVAQGMVVGALAITLVYDTFQKYGVSSSKEKK